MRILMTVDEAKALVKSRLSEKRYKHTINVKKMAVKLAKRYGADEEKAALAALLHDSAKELPKAEMLQIFADNAIIAKMPPSALRRCGMGTRPRFCARHSGV